MVVRCGGRDGDGNSSAEVMTDSCADWYSVREYVFRDCSGSFSSFSQRFLCW